MNTCSKCGTKFETYHVYETCMHCNDGADKETGDSCSKCCGFGDYNWDEENICEYCMENED